MEYPTEQFTDDERARLAPHFTNLDGPVFALVNLPETVKGALFARYSRYPGTLRRLFLDEFADDVQAGVPFDAAEGGRAADLYTRIFLGYGDDSVAQLGGAHLAAEWVSNVLTKVIQRGRLASYLEQSTRYIAYDQPMPGGGYRYFRDSELGPDYGHAMDRLFDIYSQSIEPMSAWLIEQFPHSPGESEPAHARAIKAKALDLLRGLLPAASLSHMGMFASGQAYESLLLHLAASPLPEARSYGAMMLTELNKVIPSFLQRIERPDRGGRWIDFLGERAQSGSHWAQKLGLDQTTVEDGPSVRLVHVDGDEQLLLTSLLFESGAASESAAAAAVAAMSDQERRIAITELSGERENRRHRPGRGFESVRYRFEIVADYGAFRDLQRHRMLTCQWQPLTPDLGAGVPAEVDEAGIGDAYRAALEISASEYTRLRDAGLVAQAPYALCLGYRIRFVLDLNAREAMQLIELRSGREGHPSYRAVAHEMHRQIAERHPAVGAAMKHVDNEAEPRLERILSEMRTEAKLRSLS